MVRDLSKVIDVSMSQVENMGKWGRINQAIACKLIHDVLSIFNIGLLNLVKQVDKVDRYEGMLNTILNWVKAIVPVTVILVVMPSSLYLFGRWYFNSRKRKRIDRVDHLVSQIYRVLIYYKSAEVDCYQKDLKYKDQGLISFWVSKLKESIEFISLHEKKKLLRLVQDLNNPDLTVTQKINCINLEWGYSVH
jgi:hypothetical protein